jgi:hypothetical protein
MYYSIIHTQSKVGKVPTFRASDTDTDLPVISTDRVKNLPVHTMVLSDSRDSSVRFFLIGLLYTGPDFEAER